ncbi:IS1 family transposase [Vibrio ouci]|uniref:IS1 family transposase n=1 Tax=Vibrio ouci TaxID=2499078 RepID=A0A4Y8WGK4_9VIBR|nr:IS1 family transposase [Vibrio ouci]TFH91934.1 IS1 family transposase [Vibrio ouci]
MDNKSFSEFNDTVPRIFNGIQVNCCKTAWCENFGLTPEEIRESEAYINANKNTKERGIREKNPFYNVTSSSKRVYNIQCKGCKKLNESSNRYFQYSHVIKSNYAVFQELERISAYLKLPGEQCPNTECPSNTQDVPIQIKKRGFTRTRRQRFQCKVCNTCFTGVPARHLNQPRSEVNKTLFKYLLLGTSIRALAEGSDVSPQTIYDRIDFFHEQCMRFVAERERKLCTQNIERLYLSTDRQVQISNWTNREERKNCEFYGIATSDIDSNYVFAFNFNYDASLDSNEVNQHAEEIEDYAKRTYQRLYSRVWLEHEFIEVSNRKLDKASMTAGGSLENDIELQLQFDETLNKRDSSEYFDSTTKLPSKGMEVHNEYTMMAHFFLLKRLFANVEKTRFYMDLDSGMKAAYIAAFKNEIRSGSSDGYLVSTDKEITRDEREKIIAQNKKMIEIHTLTKYELLTNQEIDQAVQDITLLNMASPFITPRTGDRWVSIIDPRRAEQRLRTTPVTNQEKYELNHQAKLLRKGTLFPIDRFFAQIRRRVAMFERPISSGANGRRIWYAKQPYNPVMYQKIADIHRVYYNYCKPFRKHKNETPATRLGLAKGVVPLENIIYFDKYRNNRSNL